MVRQRLFNREIAVMTKSCLLMRLDGSREFYQRLLDFGAEGESGHYLLG